MKVKNDRSHQSSLLHHYFNIIKTINYSFSRYSSVDTVALIPNSHNGQKFVAPLQKHNILKYFQYFQVIKFQSKRHMGCFYSCQMSARVIFTQCVRVSNMYVNMDYHVQLDPWVRPNVFAVKKKSMLIAGRRQAFIKPLSNY